jgi:integrase
MKLSVKIRPDERKPFSERDLKTILKPEVYIKNTIGFQNGISKMKFCYYWSFIVGIFTGMRTNEIAQLRVEDIQKDSSIWFFHVEESENTKVKTRNSIRRIPIHPQLVELGFLDYAEKIRKEKKDRVFWELNKSREGYGRQLSRHFNVKYLPLVGVWEKNIKVLYCTRHTFINKLFSEKVDENVIKTLVGHEKEFTMKHYGGDPFSPERLLEEISKVNYKEINWNKLKVI